VSIDHNMAAQYMHASGELLAEEWPPCWTILSLSS